MSDSPDIALLRRLWAAGEHIEEIAKRLGCCRHHVYELRLRHGLPARDRSVKTVDPTEQEIKERAAECRRMRAAGTPIGGH
jgi:hypothetical protein